MLNDLITQMTTACPPCVRAMNYVDEATAMRRRSREHRTSWQPHLDRSRSFVLAAAEQSADRSSAVILGAGLLLDVPLGELASLFRHVVLVDIVFLPEVRRAVKRYGNVTLTQHDVTGMAHLLYHHGRHHVRELPQPEPALPALERPPGFVVSLNMLSQLWVVPRAYALKQFPGMDPEQTDDWCRRIVDSHLDLLRTLPCAVCLIADHAFVKRDRSGSAVSRDSTVCGVPLPGPDESWTWEIAPRREWDQHISKTLIVGAWRDY